MVVRQGQQFLHYHYQEPGSVLSGRAAEVVMSANWNALTSGRVRNVGIYTTLSLHKRSTGMLTGGKALLGCGIVPNRSIIEYYE